MHSIKYRNHISYNIMTYIQVESFIMLDEIFSVYNLTNMPTKENNKNRLTFWEVYRLKLSCMNVKVLPLKLLISMRYSFAPHFRITVISSLVTTVVIRICSAPYGTFVIWFIQSLPQKCSTKTTDFKYLGIVLKCV